MRLRIFEEAEDDLDHAAGYYELHTEGQGQRFLVQARATFQYALEHPHAGRLEQHARLGRTVRAYQIGVYPYDVLTTIEDDTLIVFAIKDQRRRPGYWVGRLKKL